MSSCGISPDKAKTFPLLSCHFLQLSKNKIILPLTPQGWQTSQGPQGPGEKLELAKAPVHSWGSLLEATTTAIRILEAQLEINFIWSLFKSTCLAKTICARAHLLFKLEPSQITQLKGIFWEPLLWFNPNTRCLSPTLLVFCSKNSVRSGPLFLLHRWG